jgi:hypothetical protein
VATTDIRSSLVTTWEGASAPTPVICTAGKGFLPMG